MSLSFWPLPSWLLSHDEQAVDHSLTNQGNDHQIRLETSVWDDKLIRNVFSDRQSEVGSTEILIDIFLPLHSLTFGYSCGESDFMLA